MTNISVVQEAPFDDEFEDLIGQSWQHIVETINHVLHADRTFGFSKFELTANPSVEEIELALNFADEAIKLFLSHADRMKHELVNTLFNCQQSVFLMRRLFIAVKRKDNAEYDDCISKLTSQRKH